MNFQYELALITIAFLIRTPFFFLVGSEEFAHRAFQYGLKTGMIRADGRANYSFLPGYLAYPILLHKIINLFPGKPSHKKSITASICFDCASTLLIFEFAVYALSLPKFTAFLLGLAFTLAPPFISLTARIQGGGARTFGLLIFLTFILIGNVTPDRPVFVIPLLVIAVLIAVHSSQFATQAIIFTSTVLPFFGIYIYACAVLIGILWILFFDKVGKMQLLSTFYWHKRYYIKHERLVGNDLPTVRRNNFLHLPFSGKCFDSTKLRSFFYLSPIWTLLQNFGYIYLIVLLGHGHFMAYIYTMIIIATATFFWPLSVYGSSERYLEYGIPFVFLGIAEAGAPHEHLFILIILSVVFISFQYFLLFRGWSLISQKKKLFFNNLSLGRTIKKVPMGKNLLVVPVKDSLKCFQFIQKRNIKTFYMVHSISREVGMDVFIPYVASSGLYPKSLRYFYNSGVNYFLLRMDSTRIGDKSLTEWYKDLAVRESLRLKLMYENSRYCLFELSELS